ncbi:hypothetical protein CCHR01_06973 [Colletotrichum chrysophilum]|uniref:Uncharacterized protein n=1 Tax=Colletotrichum chrysophilum TaxID=1836956 RepID=A0AAD9EMZ9_9PEZI|nr:hypothetical protein CCHR01_06973 [Colletotrichum chrysophilum]
MHLQIDIADVIGNLGHNLTLAQDIALAAGEDVYVPRKTPINIREVGPIASGAQREHVFMLMKSCLNPRELAPKPPCLASFAVAYWKWLNGTSAIATFNPPNGLASSGVHSDVSLTASRPLAVLNEWLIGWHQHGLVEGRWNMHHASTAASAMADDEAFDLRAMWTEGHRKTARSRPRATASWRQPATLTAAFPKRGRARPIGHSETSTMIGGLSQDSVVGVF